MMGQIARLEPFNDHGDRPMIVPPRTDPQSPRSYNDQMTSMRLYTTPHSSAWTIYTDSQALGAQWCAPCIYVKVRNGVYIFTINEEACNGAEMCVMINTKITHDCGFGFSGGANGVALSLTGAIGRHIGHFHIKEYFGSNAKGRAAWTA